MTNDTFSGNRHMYVGIEHIWTHLIGFMEIFQVGGFPNLEYQFLQVILGALALLLKVTVTNDTYSGKGYINLGFLAYSDTTYWIHVNLGTNHILILTNKC